MRKTAAALDGTHGDPGLWALRQPHGFVRSPTAKPVQVTVVFRSLRLMSEKLVLLEFVRSRKLRPDEGMVESELEVQVL